MQLRSAPRRRRVAASTTDSGATPLVPPRAAIAQVAALEGAIAAGYIRWVGKPMNIFPELTDGGLFERGLRMTEALN